MFDKIMRLVAWLCIFGGVATAAYVGYAFVIGEIQVSTRGAGTSIYTLREAPGPFYGFVAVYVGCAVLFLVIGVLSLRDKKK